MNCDYKNIYFQNNYWSLLLYDGNWNLRWCKISVKCHNTIHRHVSALEHRRNNFINTVRILWIFIFEKNRFLKLVPKQSVSIWSSCDDSGSFRLIFKCESLDMEACRTATSGTLIPLRPPSRSRTAQPRRWSLWINIFQWKFKNITMYHLPESTITQSANGLSRPSVFEASILRTTLIPLIILPKTTWRPSSHVVCLNRKIINTSIFPIAKWFKYLNLP